MSKKDTSFNVLHICDYAALYRGNFIDSLESIEEYHENVKNYYLFPARTRNTKTNEWIDAMNQNGTVAYIQDGSLLKNLRLLSKIIKKNKINRVVRHFYDFKIDIALKFLFSGKKVVRFFHGGCPHEKNAVKRAVKRFIWKNNKLVGVSDAIAGEIRREFPDYESVSIVNAIHFDRLDKIDEFEKPEGISLLMMGWDYKRKGVDLAIKAVNNLRGKYDVVLQLVGGKNEEKIRELIVDILGHDADWVRFLPATNNIGTYFNATDIFLSPSRQEAFGYANIEAAYCKNSIVLSRVDGQGELNIEGAYWIERDNVDDFTEKLEAAIVELNDPEKIAQRERVKEQVKQIYSLEEWSNKLVALF